MYIPLRFCMFVLLFVSMTFNTFILGVAAQEAETPAPEDTSGDEVENSDDNNDNNDDGDNGNNDDDESQIEDKKTDDDQDEKEVVEEVPSGEQGNENEDTGNDSEKGDSGENTNGDEKVDEGEDGDQEGGNVLGRFFAPLVQPLVVEGPICHVPKGNPSAANTIYPGEGGYNGHKQHDDDYEGECIPQGGNTGGDDTPEYPYGIIISPEADEEVDGDLYLEAEYYDGDDENDDAVQWAVRKGTCAANTNTVFGNVDGHSDSASWDGMYFSTTLDASGLEPGDYCFVFNPTDDGNVDVRETQWFVVPEPNDGKDPFDPGKVENYDNLCLYETVDGEYPADEAVYDDQGLDNNDEAVKAARSNPEQGLQFEAAKSESNFYSLGFGGEFIVKFDTPIVNGDGDDVRIIETTWSAYPTETADVYASKDGLTWELLGEAQSENGSGSNINFNNDFDLGSLDWAQFIKIVDTSDVDDFDAQNGADGIDINAVLALHVGEYDDCAPSCSEVLYGVNDSRHLNIVDPDTGDFTYVTDLEVQSWAVAADNATGYLYYLSTNGEELGVYDPATGDADSMDVTGDELANTSRLAFNPKDGLMYAGDQNLKLFTITTSGVATELGTISGAPAGGGDLAFGPDGTLYVIGHDGVLYTVNYEGDLSATSLGDTGLARPSGIAWQDDGLYVSNMSNSDNKVQLYFIDLGDVANPTAVGSINSVRNQDLASCVSYVEPEPEQPEYANYCGDGIVNQKWEQCDAGLEGDYTCTAQCQLVEQNQCTDLALAQVVTERALNQGNGNMTSDVFVGQDELPIPAGAWFPLYWLGSYFVDPDVNGEDGYEDVPGYAIERQEGSVRLVMHGGQTSKDDEFAEGYINFWNTTPTDQREDTEGANVLENPFDGTHNEPFADGNDELDLEDGLSKFILKVSTGDDGFYTDYTTPEACTDPDPEPTCLVEGYKYDEEGTPLSGWTIGLAGHLYEYLAKLVSVDENYEDGLDILATDVTDENGYYCLAYDFDEYESGSDYIVYEELQEDWFTVDVEVDEESVTWFSDEDFDAYVPIELDEEEAVQVDFYNVFDDFEGSTEPTDPESTDDDPAPGISGGGYLGSARTSGGSVLGAFSGDGSSCGLYLNDYMRQGLVNDPEQVMKLQQFLNEQGIVVPTTGFFGSLTDTAVRTFQATYATEVLLPWQALGFGDGSPTGYVFKTTRWKINDIMCPGIETFPILP